MSWRMLARLLCSQGLIKGEVSLLYRIVDIIFLCLLGKSENARYVVGREAEIIASVETRRR